MNANAVLIVVDAQVGFVNENSRAVLDPIAHLVDAWSATGRPVVFTRYHNYDGSPFERILGWSRVREAPETDIAQELVGRAETATRVLEKRGYSCLTGENLRYFTQQGWTDLYFCGIATDSCVLKSAADGFEAGFVPWLVTDACSSDAGSDVHDAALTVAGRLIGRTQLITSTEALQHLALRKEDDVA